MIVRYLYIILLVEFLVSWMDPVQCWSISNGNMIQDNTWERIYPFSRYTSFARAIECNNRTIVAVGFTAKDSDIKALIVNCDANGDTLWKLIHNVNLEGNSEAYWVSETLDSNYIVSGHGSLVNSGMMLKISRTGKIIFEKNFGFGLEDQILNVKQLYDGSFILLIRSLSFSTERIVLAKTDSGGNLLWFKEYDGKDQAIRGLSLQIMPNGEFVIVGSKFVSQNTPKLLIMRVGENGDSLWSYTDFEYPVSSAYSVDTIPHGGFIIGGRADSILQNSQASLLIAFDSNNKIKWRRRYSAELREKTYSLCYSKLNEIVFSGSSDSTLFGQEHAFIRAVDSSGNEKFMSYFSAGEFSNEFRSVAKINSGGYLLAGYAERVNLDLNSYMVRTDSLGRIEPVSIMSSIRIVPEFDSVTCFPNPFNAFVNVEFVLRTHKRVKLLLYDNVGRLCMTLPEAEYLQGDHKIEFDFTGPNFSSGVYFVKVLFVSSNSKTILSKTIKLLCIK